MTFKDAHAKLKAIAEGRYCSIRYELTTLNDGSLESCCSIYIDGMKWHSGKTWDEVFHSLNMKIHPEQYVEQMPEVEA
jgi:hypothetical protein